MRGLTLLVAHVIRPADAEIERANQFNPDPEPGNEYVMVELVLTCKKDSDETCLVSPAFDLELAGSKGIVREPDIFIAGVPHMLERTEFFGGVTVSGWLDIRGWAGRNRLGAGL